jgi:hypothetical protein
MAISRSASRGRSALHLNAPASDSSADAPRFRSDTPDRLHGKPDIQPSRSRYQSLRSQPAHFRRMDSLQKPTQAHPPMMSECAEMHYHN